MSAARLRAALVIIVFLTMGTMITRGSYAGSGDAIHYMQIARSLAFDHDLDLANDYHDPANILQVPPGNHAIAGRGGVLRPVHDIGLPLIAAPVFAAAYRLAGLTDRLPASIRRRARLTPFIALRQLMSLFMIAVTAVLAIVFFETASRLTGARTPAFLWTLAWTLSPPILSHGSVFFTEVPSALVALYAFSQRDAVLGERYLRNGLALGLLAGFLLLLHVRNVGLVLALVLMMAWRIRHEPRRGAGVAAGLLAMGLVKASLNVDFWGTIVTTPHEQFGAWPGGAAFLSEMFMRAGGLLFDPRHGLLCSAPIFLLAPAAWVVLARRHRAAANELLLLVAAYLLFVLLPVTNVHGWDGGWSPPARFLVPLVPFMALAWPVLRPRGVSRLVIGATVALQVGLDSFFWAHPMQLWTMGPGPAPFLDSLIGRNLSGRIPVWSGPSFELAAVFTVCVVSWAILTRWLVVHTLPLDERSVIPYAAVSPLPRP